MSAVSVFIGTYTRGSDSSGIYHAMIDQQTGQFQEATCAGQADNPSYLCMSKDGATLFAVSEVDDFNGQRTGGVTSFSLSSPDNHLRLINTQPSGGRAPCYLSTRNGHLFTANYVDGTVATFSIADSGRLSPATSIVQHSGLGPNVDRQEGPHAHSIVPVPNSGYLLATDLGTDEVITYKLTDAGKLNRVSVWNCEPGAGPRHIAFHPHDNWLFILNELNNTVVLYRYNPENGTLSFLSSASTLPVDFKGESIAADIHCSVDGRFIYCTNRGHESIAVFAFNQDDELLECIQIISCGGEHPRNFTITPNGKFLLCANQNTHNIVTFRLDQQTGCLSETGITSRVPMPVCLCLC